MIARVWHGWTPPQSADAYERFLRTQVFPSIHRVPGYLGADLLRREDGDEIAFVTITRFESLESVRAFAGEDYEQAVVEPEAADCSPDSTSAPSITRSLSTVAK